MAATKLQMNWTAVAFASTSITNVTSVSFNQGGQLADFGGDADQFPTVIAHTASRPSASVTSGDAGTLMAMASGTTGSLNATHNDAKLAVGGAIVYVLSNAVVENVQTNGSWAQFGSATATFKAFSSDGSTNPLAFTRT